MRLLKRLLIAVLVAMLFTPGAFALEGGGETDASQGRVVIEGVAPYRLVEPLFEAIRVVLSHRGESYSPEYIAGISGAAFRIAGICPCAPTSSMAMSPAELPKLLGYEVEHLTLESCGVDWGDTPFHLSPVPKKLVKQASLHNMTSEEPLTDPDLKKLQDGVIEMISKVRDTLRQGRPVVLWHAFTNAEFDVVTGYDEDEGVLLGRGSYVGNGAEYTKAPQYRTLTAAFVGGMPSAILIGDKSMETDLRTVEVSALREAVKHAHSQKNAEKIGKEKSVFLEGIACYNQWIESFRNPEKKRGVGDAYNYGVYRDTHRAAAVFLDEIADRYPRASVHIEKAAAHFRVEAETLKNAEPLLWWQSPEGPDVDRNRRVVEILTRARGEYASGIAEIELALAKIDNR